MYVILPKKKKNRMMSTTVHSERFRNNREKPEKFPAASLFAETPHHNYYPQ